MRGQLIHSTALTARFDALLRRCRTPLPIPPHLTSPHLTSPHLTSLDRTPCSLAEAFTEKVVELVSELKRGLPWEEDVSITPLPEPSKPAYLAELMSDALDKGAACINEEHGGGVLDSGGALFTPAVMYPTQPHMRLFQEEQFGPVMPIAKFSDVEEVHTAVKNSWV